MKEGAPDQLIPAILKSGLTHHYDHVDVRNATLLAAMGVQYGQGYALARPMGLKAFLAFMNKV